MPLDKDDLNRDAALQDSIYRRQEVLVAREGVLTQIMEEWEFPTEDHKKVFDLLYKETLDEMKDLGLVPFEDSDWEDS